MSDRPVPANHPAQVPAGQPGASEGTHDPDRRRFFRQFAGDVVSSVGSMLGAAQMLQQESADAARDLLGATDGPAPVGGVAPPRADGATAQQDLDASTAGFRAAYRWEGDACLVVDQRRLPDTISEIVVRGAADAVTAFNDGMIVGAAAQAQVAAVTVALVANRSAGSRPYARRATIRGAANAMKLSRPASAALRGAVDRMLGVLEAQEADIAGETLAALMRAEAEAVIREASDAHGALVGHVLEALPDNGEEPLRVLTLGSTGAMGGGQYGTALSALIAAHHAERPIRALVAETRPLFEGSRIAAWELRQAGVEHAVVTDAAAPGAIAAGEVDLVLVGAERVAANGDVVGVAGTYPLALAAAAAGIPFLVCAPTTAVDAGLEDGGEAPLEQARVNRLLNAAGNRIAPQGTQVRSRSQDLTPASLVTGIVTEEGVLRPPFGPGLAEHVAAVRALRGPVTGPGTGVVTPQAEAVEREAAAAELAAVLAVPAAGAADPAEPADVLQPAQPTDAAGAP